MSTLTVQTISNGTVSTSSANVIQGSARAWVNFQGFPTTIRASYNVSSVTRLGTGNYTISFTAALPDANYAWTSAEQRSIGVDASLAKSITYSGDTISTTTLQIRYFVVNPNSSGFEDPSVMNIAVFR